MAGASRTVVQSLLSVLYLAAAAWVGLSGHGIAGRPALLIALAVMFGAMVALWLLRPAPRAVYRLLALGVLARAAFLNYPGTDDVCRYLWEGRIQLAGHNPFSTSPDAPELADHRDANWQGITHRLTPTIYWPASQMLFALAAAIAPVALTCKVLFLLFDLGTLLLLAMLGRRLDAAPRHLLFYGLNPLVIMYVAGEGHVEPVMVFFCVLALHFHVAQRHRLSFASLGMAIMAKTVPVILVPFLITRRSARHAWALLPPLALFLPYVTGSRAFLGIPAFFATQYHYNGLVQTLLEQVMPSRTATYVAAGLALAALVVIRVRMQSPLQACRAAVAVYLLCAPTMHPWYLLLMTPFLALEPSWPWLILHLICLPLVNMWDSRAVGWLWHDRTLLMWAEYAPFVLAAVWLWLRARRRRADTILAGRTGRME